MQSHGPDRERAAAELHELMLRAARYQVSRIPDADRLGAARREEVVNSAADHATMAVLGKLESFEGRSRFTTWAYKFGILQAGVEVRRAAWKDREVDIDDIPEPSAPVDASPESVVEGRDLARIVQQAITSELTPHQRRVATALLIEEVPIDVLAERMDTNRNALYKTLHVVRGRLRTHLTDNGLLTATDTEEVTR